MRIAISNIADKFKLKFKRGPEVLVPWGIRDPWQAAGTNPYLRYRDGSCLSSMFENNHIQVTPGSQRYICLSGFWNILIDIYIYILITTSK